MVLGLPVSMSGNAAKTDFGIKIQTQNLEVSTSGETTVLSFNLHEKGQGLGKGGGMK